MSEDNSDRIIVRKNNLARCQWCGTPESPFWTISQREKIFCSHECMLASQSTNKRLSGIVTLCCGLLFVIPFIYFMFLFPPPSEDFGAVIFLMTFGLPLLLCGIYVYSEGEEGLKYRDRKDKYRGISPVICSYCSHQNSPYLKACQNCGAALTGAPFARDSTPPWFRKRARKGVYKCPHCTAVYSYRQAPISQDGMVTCQNCTRPFRHTKPTGVKPQSRHFY